MRWGKGSRAPPGGDTAHRSQGAAVLFAERSMVSRSMCGWLARPHRHVGPLPGTALEPLGKH